jgi:hypothetical protein
MGGDVLTWSDTIEKDGSITLNLILIGCEWAGKRTLGNQIAKWWSEQTGGEHHPPPEGIHFHDHYTVPHVVHIGGHDNHKEQSEKDILKLNPGILEHFQRYQIEYHFGHGFVQEGDHWNIDWYYGDAVYAPLYWGYGRPGEYGDRRSSRQHYDEEVLRLIPDTILVLVKATADTIRNRMNKGNSPYPSRHTGTMFKLGDAEYVLDRFQEEFDNSLIAHSFSIDTSSTTPEESLQEFIAKVEPHLTAKDRERMGANK